MLHENINLLVDFILCLFQTDALSRAEILLYIESLETGIRSLLGEDVSAREDDLKFLFEKAFELENKQKPQWDKLAQALEPQVARPRADALLASLAKENTNSADGEVGKLYKAPKTMAVHYTKDKKRKRGGDDSDSESEDEKKRERLRRSEFVKAITEDLVDTPRVIDDGDAELDTKSRKLINKFKDQHLTNGKAVTKKDKRDLQRFKDLQDKKGRLNVGSDLKDMSGFFDRITR